MFPISDSIKSNKFPFVTLLLIAANIFVFYQELTSSNLEIFLSQYALVPRLISFTNPQTLLPFISAMFLHGGFFHIISNMWFLWIFGDDVEAHVGKLWYILLYFTAGILGFAAQLYANPNSSIPMLGASGAISGVLGAYYVLFPNARIKTILILFFFITIVNIPAVVYLLYWFVLQLLSGVNTVSAQGGVAFWAHAAGFITGVIFANIFKREAQKSYIEGEIVEN